jgi:hypothetical protein
MGDMMGDPNEKEDILGFGDTDRPSRGRRLDRLTLFLDRVTLRITRRPRLLAIAAGLAVVVLAGGGISYLSIAHPASHPAAGQPRALLPATALQCIGIGQSKSMTAALNKIIKQLKQAASGTSSAYPSDLQIHVGSGAGSGIETQITIAIPNLSTEKIACRN